MIIPRPSSNVHLAKDDAYRPEVWAWYGVGLLVIFLRFAVRLRTVGFRGLKPDDYMTLLFLGLWTVNAIIVEITYFTGGNVDVLPGQASTLSEHDVEVLTYGSIWEFVSWYTYSGIIWTLKIQVLFFYKRLNLDIIRPLAVNVVFVFTLLAYVALAMTISLSCRPYRLNWQIDPLPGPECVFRPQNFWTLVVLNVITDLAIMSIPTPYLFRLRVTWPRKIGVSLLLLSGVFMIATAIVRAVETLGGAPSVINVNRWGFRETGVGMIAVNAAVLLPLLKRRFWRCGAYVNHARPRPPVAEERCRRPSGPGMKVLADIWLWTESVVSNSGSTLSRNTQRGRDGGESQVIVLQGVELDEVEGKKSTQIGEVGQKQPQMHNEDVEAGCQERRGAYGVDAADTSDSVSVEKGRERAGHKES